MQQQENNKGETSPVKKPVFHQSKMKLGALAPVFDPRTFQLSDFINTDKVKIPESHYWGKGIGERDWGLMRNDEMANCTIATAGHMIMGWNADAGRQVKSKADYTTTYLIVGGYLTFLAGFSSFIYFAVKKNKQGHGGK